MNKCYCKRGIKLKQTEEVGKLFIINVFVTGACSVAIICYPVLPGSNSENNGYITETASKVLS